MNPVTAYLAGVASTLAGVLLKHWLDTIRDDRARRLDYRADEDLVYRSLPPLSEKHEYDAVSARRVVDITGWPPAKVHRVLDDLEASGRVSRTAHHEYYSKRRRVAQLWS